MSKRQKRKVVLHVKKACRTRWLSLDASVNAVFEEYVGLLHLLRILREGKSAGPTATRILKKVENFRFLGTLYLMKFMLSHLSILSKTFQTGSLNFSRVILSLNKTKNKIMAVANENEAYRELEKDIAGRLSLCQTELTDFMKKSIKRDIKIFAMAMSDNIDARFPQNAQKVLETFSVFNLDILPSDSSASIFTLYGEREI